MIFQKPMSSLNPVFTVGYQFTNILKLHHHLSRHIATRQAAEALASVALSDPDNLLRRYPYELSGGMQQRVLLAMALACKAKLLIADEPTTALDVSVQLQLLKLLERVQATSKMSILLVSHDLAVVSSICDRIIIMYAGTIVESGQTSQIIYQPEHPYTQGLIKAVPDFAPRKVALGVLQGEVPNLAAPPTGCRFYPRCPIAMDICKSEQPRMLDIGTQHTVACHAKREKMING